MRFLLDSNAVIALFKGIASVQTRIRGYHVGDFGLPAIVAQELYFGAARSGRPAVHAARLDALQFEVVAFDREDARQAGRLRAHLANLGTPIGAYDSLIAGQALARGLTLVTHNTREFARVPNLRFEDWEG